LKIFTVKKIAAHGIFSIAKTQLMFEVLIDFLLLRLLLSGSIAQAGLRIVPCIFYIIAGYISLS
jgi:hypothetical protein